jgi:replication-associated recombination protein RarA
MMAVAQERVAQYDKDGEQHYDIISAFIKSIRGSDANAAIYWLARMLAGGEDIKFIARRLVISAAEDIGNANPNALLLANSAFDAVAKIGMPEARIILSQATIYLATSPKSNASYMAINAAMEFVKSHPDYPVPLHLRNAVTSYMKSEGYGAGYKYSHDFQLRTSCPRISTRWHERIRVSMRQRKSVRRRKSSNSLKQPGAISTKFEFEFEFEFETEVRARRWRYPKFGVSANDANFRLMLVYF